MKQKIGTFNCQSILTSAAKEQVLVNDFELYKISALAVQEMYIQIRMRKIDVLYQTDVAYNYFTGSFHEIY